MIEKRNEPEQWGGRLIVREGRIFYAGENLILTLLRMLTILCAALKLLSLPYIFIYSSRKLRGRMGGLGQGGPFRFAKSKARRFTPESSQTTFGDVAGLENAKRELTEIVDFLKNPAKFEMLGGNLPRGLLFAGPPGVGKTLMAQAMAGEAGVPFFSISGSECIEMLVGVGASRVRGMFARAKKEAPAVIFIDELDSIGRARGVGVDTTSGSRY